MSPPHLPQEGRDAGDREARLVAAAQALGSDLQDRRRRIEEALARSEAQIARARASIERVEAAARRTKSNHQRHQARTRRACDDPGYQASDVPRETTRDLSESITRAQAARSHALALRSAVRDTAVVTAALVDATRLARQTRTRRIRGQP